MTRGCYIWTKCAEPDSIPPVLLKITCALSMLPTVAALVGCFDMFSFVILFVLSNQLWLVGVEIHSPPHK